MMTSRYTLLPCLTVHDCKIVTVYVCLVLKTSISVFEVLFVDTNPTSRRMEPLRNTWW